MKKYIILLLIILQVKTFAGTIPVGLTSNNLFAWGVWENDKGVLRHYLYIYNKTKKEIKIQILQKKFKSVGTNFEEVKMNKEIYKTFLAPSRITKLDYPTTTDRMSFMGFVEDEKPVGILAFNLEEPLRSFVDNKFKFYVNSGINGGKENVWIRFASIYDPHSDIAITSNIKNAGDAQLLKIINPKDDTKKYERKLDSLQQTDNSILKLDQTTNIRATKLQTELGQEKFIFIPILTEEIQNGRKIASGGMNVAVFKE